MRLALALLWFSLLSSGHAQGVMLFSNIGATDPDKVWLYQVGTENGGVLAPHLQTFDYRYRVALYFAPDGMGTDDSLFVQIGVAAPIGPVAGLFSGGHRTIPASAAGEGGIVNLQVRGWNGVFGETYEAALNSGDPLSLVGKSVVFRIDTAVLPVDPILSVLGNQEFQTGWRGFALTAVPEPSVVGLALFGAGTLIFVRRRR